ncbi:MAG: hypothetical protein ACRDN0_01585 [Trebonia sp.]
MTATSDDAQGLRAALRAGLATALKARDRDALAALRTAIAAIDNAEAVPVPDTGEPVTSAHIAGARSGPGSAEAARRRLTAGELHDILRGQIAEQTSEADRYDALGQSAAGERLRRQSRTLAAYLP